MSDDDVQYGITDDYFDAVPAGDEVAVRRSDNVAVVLTDLLRGLIRFFEDGHVPEGSRFGRGRSPEAVLRDMFPDAYRDRAEARSFRERHAGVLRDTAAIRRVVDRLVSGTTHVIDRQEVDDWIVALGLSRFLRTRRNARKLDEYGIWTNYAQAVLVGAVNPAMTDP